MHKSLGVIRGDEMWKEMQERWRDEVGKEESGGTGLAVLLTALVLKLVSVPLHRHHLEWH